MDRTSIRAWRRIQKKRVWRNRLRWIFRAYGLVYVKDKQTANMREPETWKELREAEGYQVYRTTGTPCSCALCKGERYNRHTTKRDTIRIITKELYMD